MMRYTDFSDFCNPRAIDNGAVKTSWCSTGRQSTNNSDIITSGCCDSSASLANILPVVLRSFDGDVEPYYRHHRTENRCEESVSVHCRKDSPKSTESSQEVAQEPLATAITSVVSSKSLQLKPPRRKNSIGCLNAFYSSTDHSQSPPYCYSISGKSQSLPGHASYQGGPQVDTSLLTVLRISAEELANQLTLLDFQVFSAIRADELKSCSWTKKNKQTVAPNIVAFTRRFNHTSFWTVQEILSEEHPRQRADVLSHFIKIARKLYELNNLHSLFAIISAMQSASIYRLKKTWDCVSKRDRQSVERLSDIFSENNNWEKLRSYLDGLRLPCIPYLGLFLTDIIYIDLAFSQRVEGTPKTDLASNDQHPSELRLNHMNNILQIISDYQQSNYSHVRPVDQIQKYLRSICFIEELQNIFEEDQYRKSLKLEPRSPHLPSSSSCSSKESFNMETVQPTLTCLNLSPARAIGSVRLPNASVAKFIHGHRKSRSLGTNIFGRINANGTKLFPRSDTSGDMDDYIHRENLHDASALHPLDDSVLEQTKTTPASSASSKIPFQGNESQNVNKGDHVRREDSLRICRRFLDNNSARSKSHGEIIISNHNSIEGYVRRKTLRKKGRKPAVSSWQRYWLQIWSNALIYFAPKSFKGSERSNFKRDPSKVCLLEGWLVRRIMEDTEGRKHVFELWNNTLATVYKFRTESAEAAELWVETIKRNVSCNDHLKASMLPPHNVNLMTFE